MKSVCVEMKVIFQQTEAKSSDPEENQDRIAFDSEQRLAVLLDGVGGCSPPQEFTQACLTAILQGYASDSWWEAASSLVPPPAPLQVRFYEDPPKSTCIYWQVDDSALAVASIGDCALWSWYRKRDELNVRSGEWIVAPTHERIVKACLRYDPFKRRTLLHGEQFCQKLPLLPGHDYIFVGATDGFAEAIDLLGFLKEPISYSDLSNETWWASCWKRVLEASRTPNGYYNDDMSLVVTALNTDVCTNSVDQKGLEEKVTQ